MKRSSPMRRVAMKKRPKPMRRFIKVKMTPKRIKAWKKRYLEGEWGNLKRFKPMRKVGKVGKARKVKMRTALETYYAKFSPFVSIPCQICGMAIINKEADPCHKYRRWKGLHEPTDILAGHRMCHQWLDNSAHIDRIKWAQQDPASCATGGVIAWPLEHRYTLIRWLTTGIDRLRVK